MKEPVFCEKLLEQDWEIIRKGLADYSEQHNQSPYIVEPAAFVYRDENRLIGGLTGWSARNGFDIGALWVSPDVREQGIGSNLVRAAEEVAKRRGCLSIFVWTMSYQAPGFYTKLGFERALVKPTDKKGTQQIGYLKILSK